MKNFFMLIAGIACFIGIIISILGIITIHDDSFQLLLVRLLIPVAITAGTGMILTIIFGVIEDW